MQRFLSSHAHKFESSVARRGGDHMLGTSLAGLPAFLGYFGVSAAIVVAYLFI
jgi:hypothetical protein